MSRTFLELVQATANEIGIPEPQYVIGASDDTSKQLLALSNREIKDFATLANRRGGWTALHSEYTFATVSGTDNYVLPSDFEYFINRTFFNGAMSYELVGGISAQEKQILRYGLVGQGTRQGFYVRNKRLYLTPEPSAVETIAYDYYSNAPVTSETGDNKQRWTLDTDTYRLDEDCFILGLKWRFLRAKGMDYSQEFRDYEMDVQRVISRDGGSREIPLGGNYGMFLGACTPENGFGGAETVLDGFYDGFYDGYYD